jgi:hypothetical protein
VRLGGLGSSGVVRVVDWDVVLVCDSRDGVVVVEVCESTCTIESCDSSAAMVGAGVVETMLIVVSSRLMFMTGISKAGFINLSSMDGGRPFLAILSAFLRSTWRSFSRERRYMDSSPTWTVSQNALILFSIMTFKDGYCDKRALRCRDEAARVSRWSSKARKCCFVSFAFFGTSAGRMMKRISMGVAIKSSALFVI